MNNVLIRPLELMDASFSWEWRNDPEVWNFTGKKPNKYITHEIEEEWIQKVLLQANSKRFAIIVNNIYVGNIQLTNIEQNKTAEYHIFIGNRKYWSKGIGFLATTQIIRYAKTFLNLKELYLFVHPDNINGIKLYEKCNFKKIDSNIKMTLNLLENLIPKVSIFMMVYNHEKYLEIALNSILSQKCNFDFEIVVGEDNSKDGSRNLLLNYAERFPGKFKLLLHKENIGAQKNQMSVFENCSGKYIAMCEGDDYWTDPLKLQKQVDFLESNPDYVLSFHEINILKLNGEIVDDFITKVPENYETIETLARLGNYIHTPSVVFRNVIKEFPFEFEFSPIGDYFLYLILAEHGKLKFLEEKMAVYRYGVGVFSAKNHISILAMLNKQYACMLSYLKDENIRKIILERNLELISRADSDIKKLYSSNNYIAANKSYFNLLKINLKKIFKYKLN